MSTVHLWPAPGRACPRPEKGGELLPAEGAPVPLNAYWQRRINDGDAVKTEPTPVPAEASAAPVPADKPKTTRSAKA